MLGDRRAYWTRHPRCTFHFVSTTCPWLNAIDRFSLSSQVAVEKTAYFIPSSICRPPSTSLSRRITRPPALSSGRSIWTKLCTGTKCRIQPTGPDSWRSSHPLFGSLSGRYAHPAIDQRTSLPAPLTKMATPPQSISMEKSQSRCLQRFRARLDL